MYPMWRTQVCVISIIYLYTTQLCGVCLITNGYPLSAPANEFIYYSPADTTWIHYNKLSSHTSARRERETLTAVIWLAAVFFFFYLLQLASANRMTQFRRNIISANGRLDDRAREKDAHLNGQEKHGAFELASSFIYFVFYFNSACIQKALDGNI